MWVPEPALFGGRDPRVSGRWDAGGSMEHPQNPLYVPGTSCLAPIQSGMQFKSSMGCAGMDITFAGRSPEV